MISTALAWILDNFNIYLALSFLLGILGMFILSYRDDSYNYENGKKRKSSTFIESGFSLLIELKRLAKESKLQVVIILIVLALIGGVVLFVSLLPRILNKRWLS